MNPILKAHIEGVEEFDKLAKQKGIGGLARIFYKSFLTTYAINLLKAAKEAGPGEEAWSEDLMESVIDTQTHIEAWNSCRSSFHSTIDEGIKEISN